MPNDIILLDEFAKAAMQGLLTAREYARPDLPPEANRKDLVRTSWKIASDMLAERARIMEEEEKKVCQTDVTLNPSSFYRSLTIHCGKPKPCPIHDKNES